LPTPSSPDAPRSPKWAQRLRQHLAALSVVGALMVTLPVVQVLRFQAEQIETLVRHRASLNPIVRAVEVQRGLLAHKDLSAQVLRGREAMEAPRQQRQLDIDQRLQALLTDLGFMNLALAQREAQSLRDDFVTLATQVTQRRIVAADSDAGHRLLVEQTLQVMDLAQDLGDDVTASLQDADTRLALQLTRELPRAAWQLGQAGAAVEVATAQALRLQHLGEWHGLAARHAAASSASAPSAIAQATQAAATSLQAWMAQSLTADPQDASTDAARAQAMVAQWQLFDLAHATASQTLNRQVDAAHSRRLQTLSWILALAMLAAGLLARLWSLSAVPKTRPPSPQEATDEDANDSEHPPSGAHTEAQILLQRLRWAEAALKTTTSSRITAAEPPPRDPGN
jgi:hypothetical protein